MANLPTIKDFDVPVNPGQVIADTAEAWEVFVRDGQFLRQKPRDVIAASWTQCRDQGMNPEATRAPTVLSFDQLTTYMKEHVLGQAGSEVLNSYSSLMAGSEHVLVLADAKGQLVHSVGHEHIQRKLESINFMPGSIWSEDTVGPNGIGTPLALGRPELVLGTEHYCQGWQPWVCYGAPIHAPGDAGLIGAIDITGPAEMVSRESMTLAISIAKSIEQILLIKHLEIRERRQELLESLHRRWPNEGLLLLQADGEFLDLNPKASRMLNLDIRNLTRKVLADRFPVLWRNLQPILIRGEGVDDFVFAANGDIELNCRIESVQVRGQSAVWVLILTEKPKLGYDKQEEKNPYFTFDDIKGESRTLLNAVYLARAAAHDPLRNPVLIQGETGTGKELIAQAIHSASDRRSGPFIAINCGALPADLIETELFGYEGGAFTGAKREGMPGKFEAANGGTIFLDEIDSMSRHLQVKLLRIIEDGTVTRVGSHRALNVDCRIIAAAGRNLRILSEQAEFRLDLYHRISVLEVDLPPLRKRDRDILLLTQHFMEQACQRSERRPLQLSSAVEDALLQYHWPGNLRELHNLCQRWILTIDNGEVEMDDLPAHFFERSGAHLNGRDDSLKSLSNEIIERALEEAGGNVTVAAKQLGIARSTLYRRIKHKKPTH